jgi:DNA replication protein DnaC
MSERDFERIAESLRIRQEQARREAGGIPRAIDPSPVVQKVMSISETEVQERRQRMADQDRERVLRQRHEAWESFVNRRGRRYEHSRLGNFDQQHEKQKLAVEVLTDYCEHVTENINTGTGVLFIGPPGTGKDHLMVALCRAAILAGRTVRWENGQDLWGSVRDAISDDKNEAAMIRSYVSCDVLALSDPLPPRGEMSPHQIATLFRIIDGRYSNLRPTWVTLNVANRVEAEERMGAQIIDRLAHGSLAVICNWPSYRKASP